MKSASDISNFVQEALTLWQERTSMALDCVQSVSVERSTRGECYVDITAAPDDWVHIYRVWPSGRMELFTSAPACLMPSQAEYESQFHRAELSA